MLLCILIHLDTNSYTRIRKRDVFNYNLDIYPTYMTNQCVTMFDVAAFELYSSLALPSDGAID